MVTIEERDIAIELRRQGISWRKIAKHLGRKSYSHLIYMANPDLKTNRLNIAIQSELYLADDNKVIDMIKKLNNICTAFYC